MASPTNNNHGNLNYYKEISHGIKTAVNSINGFITMAQSKLSDASFVNDCLTKIGYSTYNLLGLLNSLQAISEINEGKIKIAETELQLGDWMHKLITEQLPFIKSRDIKLECRAVGIKDEAFIADPDILTEILYNILDNSIAYTSSGGRIVISIRQLSDTRDGRAMLEFIISDDGAGISKKKLERIFQYDPNDISNSNSGGFGLWITKNYVDALGGSIEFSSRENFGTTASVKIPMKRMVTAPRGLDLQGLNMLIATSDPAEGKSIADSAAIYGIKTTVAKSAKEAIETIEKLSAKKSGFDVALFEAEMQSGGTQLITDMRKLAGAGTTPILFSYEPLKIETKAKSVGAKAVMPRPVFATELYTVLKTKSNWIAQGEQAENIDLKGSRILIVEDNILNLQMAKAIIEEITKATVEGAQSGRDAFNMFRKNGHGYYTMVFMDINMPLMNGYDTTKRIRGCDDFYSRNIPVIAMTANDSPEDVAAALSSGMNDLVAKPIDVEKIISVIKKFITK